MSAEEFGSITAEEVAEMSKENLLAYFKRFEEEAFNYLREKTSEIALEQSKAYQLLAQNKFKEMRQQIEQEFEERQQQFEQMRVKTLEEEYGTIFGKMLAEQFQIIKYDFTVRANVEQKARHRVLSNLVDRIHKQENFLLSAINYSRQLVHASMLLVAVDELSEALLRHEPVSQQISGIERLFPVEADPFVRVTLSSIDQSVLSQGTVPDVLLASKLRKDAKLCRRLALIPEGGGPFWHLYSHVITLFLKPAEGLVGGDSVDAIMSRAIHYVDHGKLVDALREVQVLAVHGRLENEAQDAPNYSKVISEVTKPFYLDLKHRLEAQQAVSSLRAYATSFIISLANQNKI